MSDTKQTRDHLQKALSSVPSDFALRDVRYCITKALQHLEHVEKKRNKAESSKPTHAQSWNDMIVNGVQNPNTPKRTLDIINSMIDESKRKLDALQKKRQSGNSDSTGEELETLYD